MEKFNISFESISNRKKGPAENSIPRENKKQKLHTVTMKEPCLLYTYIHRYKFFSMDY